jgi:toxin ParE1/3/4
MSSASGWNVRLTAAAAFDLEEIGAWTAQRFGAEQEARYAQLIADAFKLLRDGPKAVGVRPIQHNTEILLRLHVARSGRKGRHFLIFRVISADRREIEVVRILHDSMDMAQHLPPSNDEAP